MPIVTMPDGTNVSFPDDMPKEEIRGLITQKFPDVAQPKQGFADKALDANDSMYKAVGAGFGNLGLGLIQAGLENIPTDGDTAGALEATKDAATKVRNAQNKNIDAHPIVGTAFEMAPQVATILPFGTSIPGLAAGGAGLGYLTPDVYENEIEPGGETALGRLLRPVAEGTGSALEAIGVDTKSGLGKSAQGGILAGLMGLAGKATGKTASLANKTTKSAIRRITKVNPEAVAAYKATGMQPSILTTSDNSLIQRGANNLKNVPFAAGVIEKRIGNDVNALAGKVEKTASKLGTAVNDVEGGLALQQGITKAGERAERIANRKFDARDALIPEEFPAATNNLQRVANAHLKQSNVTPLDAAVSEPAVNKITKAALKSTRPQAITTGILDANGNPIIRTVEPQVPYKSLTSARTGIGEQAGRMDAPSGLKTVYGAMSEDMLNTAKAVSPEAEAAAIKANNFYRGISQRKDKLKRFVAQDKDGTFKLAPEKAASASREELALLKRTIPRTDFDNYAASELRQLGRAKSGVQNAEGEAFSPATYLTEWDNLGTKKAILFGENTPIVQELNKAAKVAERLKNLSKTANSSQSTNNAVQLGSWALLYKMPLTFGKYAGGGYVGSKLLTSPKALRVINNYAYRPVAKNSAVFNEFSTRLYQAAAEDPELRREVGIYLNGIKRMPAAQPKVVLQDQIDAGEMPPPLAFPDFKLLEGARQ